MRSSASQAPSITRQWAIKRSTHLSTTGNSNTANGHQALFSNRTGHANTANGYRALYSNTTGGDNTANGFGALASNITGGGNTANGFAALQNATGSSSNNIALGDFAGLNLTAGSNNIDIGNRGVAAESNTTRIGVQGTQMAAYIAGIFNETVGANNLPVLIDSNGKLGTTMMSSRRFKNEIKAMDKASEAILALKPVTFQYNDDKTNTPQFGLIAEEVAEVNRDLVVRDKHGQICAVRYDAVNAMLLNEFLKEHRKVEQQGRKVEEQETTITQLKSTVGKQEATAAQQQKEIKALTASLKEQASQIQKVSAQLEMSKAAPQTVLNSQ